MDRSEITFEESLRRTGFCRCLQGGTKDAVLAELVDAMVACGLVTDRDGVLGAFRCREAQMSTGMQAGVAIPHGKHPSVRALVTFIGLHLEGVDFDALDGVPCRIFVVTLSPPETVGPHLRFLAAIGRLLGRPAVREALMNATSKDALVRALV